MPNPLGVWHLKLIFQKENMINSIKYPLLIFFIGFSNAEEKPIKINITGKVLNHNVSGIKGAKLRSEPKTPLKNWRDSSLSGLVSETD